MRVFTHAKSREGLYGARASVQFLLGFQQTKHSRPLEHISPMIVAGKHYYDYTTDDYSVRFHWIARKRRPVTLCSDLNTGQSPWQKDNAKYFATALSRFVSLNHNLALRENQLTFGKTWGEF